MRRYRPQHLDQRIVKKFALFPIFTPTEWRWLEWVKIEQIYNAIWDNETQSGWGNYQFIDE
jgi:hypothetical protein